MRAAAVVCGVVLALAVAPLAFGHGTGPDRRGLGPWVDVGRPVDRVAAPGRELTDLRTARSQTFQRSDGVRVTRQYQQSVFYRDGGDWERIDNRLERSGNRFENAANRFDVTIPKRLGDAPLRLESAGRSVSFRLLGAADVGAAVAGADATFRDVMPGVTARWSVTNDAVKEELVLRRADVPRTYRYDVAGSAGLSARSRADGGLEFVDGAGRAVFVVPAPFGYDKKGFEAPPDTVSLTARPGGSGWQVELRVKDAWLDDPDTAFPVTVDPTVEVPSAAGDCKLDEELSSESFCSVGRLEVGWGEYGSFAHDHRSILKFDVDAALPPDADVTSATLHAYLGFRETGTQNKDIRVHRVTSPWTDDASWLNSAAGIAWNTPGGDFASQIEAQISAGEEDTWYEWPITDLVSGWADRSLPNQGLMLKDDGTHTDGSMVFASTESWPGVWPFLEIAYTGGAPAGPALELTGGLRTPLSTDRSLTAEASDGDGVERVAVWLDPDLDPSIDEAEAVETDPCTTVCPAELTANFELPSALSEGRHAMLVRSDDGAGGVTRERWSFYVASLGDADRGRLGLEQWFQYDATPAGGDSNVYVNADTGNTIWHSVPIVDPGRGLSTVVNLTYNSQDDGGLLGSAFGRVPVFAGGAGALDSDRLAALSYDAAGKGFSIAVSGPTRINEPLRGVIAAAVAEDVAPAAADGLRIAMTDADGTEHVFTNVAGKWVAPPGLNMHLRRYQAGGTIADPIADKWAMTRPDGVTHFFDNLGFLTSTKDRNGNTLTYNYERVNAFDGAACATGDVIGQLIAGPPPRLCTRRLTDVVDPAGRSLEIDYEDGAILETPLDGGLPQLPLDQAGPIGRNSKISKITDHAGREYQFEYDDLGYLVRFTEAANRPDERVTGFTYEAPQTRLRDVGDDRFLDEVQDIRDGDVDSRTHIYYEDRQVLAPGADRQQRGPYQVTKRSGAYKQYTFDGDELEVKELLDDEVGHFATTTHEVDENGRPIRVTDALDTVSALTWSDDNKVTRFTRAQGTDDESATDYTYDTTKGTGVLESQTSYPSWPSTTGARTTDLVWAFGAGRHHTAAEATTGEFVADLDRFENPKPDTGWDFTFESDTGNVTARTDANDNVAETDYDAFGQIILERDEEDNEVEYHDFHPTGQPGRVVDEREKTWTYKYDTVGNVTAVVDPRAGSQTSGAEGNPFTTTLSYDSFDRLTREHIPKRSDVESPVFITRARAFDRNGNVVESVDGRGQETTIEYTPMDLPAKVIAPGSNGPEITQYAYDAGDRLIGRIAPKGDGLTSVDDVVETQAEECADEDPPLDFLTRFCLDDIGRLQAEIRYSTRSGDPNALISSFAYDRRDNLVGMVDPNRNADRTAGAAIAAAGNPSLQRMEYAHNKVDEQTINTEKPTEAGASPTVWRFSYDANGNQVEIRHPRSDAIRTHITYDHRDEVIAVEDPLGHLSCLQRRKDERVIAETTPRGTAGNHANCTNGTGYTHYTTKYEYDPAGNLTSRSVPFAPNQYGRDDNELKQWKVEYTRDEVGDPITIKDARGNSFANTFFDTGDLRTTNRPSFWQVGGGMVVERTGRSANAENSDEERPPDSTLGQTDFGKVDPEPLPGELPQAGHTELGYDGEMNLTSVVDARDKTRTMTYDPAGRVETRHWPFKADGITHSFDYDKNGNLVDSFDGLQHTTYAYDGYDRRVEQTAPGAREEAGGALFDEVTRFRYDHNGNQRFTETPRGVETSTPSDDFTFETAYDSLDRTRFERAPDGGTTSYAYDVASNLTIETRPRGQGRTGEDLESFQTRMAYDNADRMIESRQQVTDGSALDELVTSIAYDADDNQTSVTEPGAQSPEVTTEVFDGRGFLWKTTSGTGNAARTRIVEYDPNGNLRRLVNPLGVDANGNARVNDTGEDENQNLVNASKNATVFRYGNNDLLLARRMPWNSDTTENQRKYRTLFQRNDPLARVTSILSAHEVTDEGQPDDNKVPRTSYSYYDTDWIASISDQKLSDPESEVIFENRLIDFDYDKRGAQIEWKSKNAGEDSAGRHIVREFWPNGTMQTRTAEKTTPDAGETSRMYRYFYNRNESLSAMKDERNNRLTTIKRDPAERETEVNEVWANGKDSRFAYDIAGNVITRRTDGKIQTDGSFGGDDRKTTTFEYDSLDREFRMTVDPMVGADRETVINYWPSGRRQSQRKPNGTSERWFFDTRGMVTRFERQREGQNDLARETDYEYDDNANRNKDERGTYVFNARDQLTQWAKPNGQVTDYELNGDGAITRKAVDPPTGPDVVTTYKYRGERLRWSETGGDRQYYRYDDFGNVTRIIQRGAALPELNDEAPQATGCEEVPNGVASNETYFCYDEFERPRLGKGAGINDSERIDYDGLDRRDTRTFVEQGTSKTRDFSYVGSTELLSREVDNDGAKRFYDYDSIGDRLGQQVTEGSDNRFRAYTKDVNGSVLGLEGDDGQVGTGSSYDYDPYGELENAGDLNSEAQDNPFRYEGFYYDSGVKTYDMLARPYRPEVGRFLTQDRYASASQDLLLQSDPLTQNRYAFGGGNPVNNVEFDGHDNWGADMHARGCFSCKKRKPRPGSGKVAARMTREQGQAANRSSPGHTRVVSSRAQGKHYDEFEHGKPLGNKTGCAAHPEKYICVGENVYKPAGWAVAIDDCLRGGFEGFTGISQFGGPDNTAGNTCKRTGQVAGVASVAKAGVTVGIKSAPYVVRGVRSAPRVIDAAGGILRAGTSSSLRRLVQKSAGGACSFSGETRVLMVDGSRKQISKIKVGDKVIATDPLTGQQTARSVTHVWIHDDHLILLKVGGEWLATTEDHPFWNATDQAWEAAEALDVGDAVLTADGRHARVEGVDASHPRRRSAYNLAVEGVHTYHVGTLAVVVHNKCVNLPSWRKLTIDMDHIASGHMPGGARVSPNKGVFEGMTERQVQRAVRDAYNSGKRVETQHGIDGAKRVRVRGAGGGREIEMWVNLTARRVETAYPR
jgi:RHS repeat-associated protein